MEEASGGHTYLPGTASLVQEIDSELTGIRKLHVFAGNTYYLYCAERLLVVLRDGRTLIGFLRSVDQFGESCGPVW